MVGKTAILGLQRVTAFSGFLTKRRKPCLRRGRALAGERVGESGNCACVRRRRLCARCRTGQRAGGGALAQRARHSLPAIERRREGSNESIPGARGIDDLDARCRNPPAVLPRRAMTPRGPSVTTLSRSGPLSAAQNASADEPGAAPLAMPSSAASISFATTTPTESTRSARSASPDGAALSNTNAQASLARATASRIGSARSSRCRTRNVSGESSPSSQSAATRAFTPLAHMIRFSPSGATPIIANPVVPSRWRTRERSTPAASRLASAGPACASSPTAPIMRTRAPARAAASA